MSLSDEDAQHVRAAQGWLDLNNSLKATDEMAQIRSESRLHSDALEARWKVLEAGGKWEASLSVAGSPRWLPTAPAAGS